MHGVHVAPVRFRAARLFYPLKIALKYGLVAHLVERRIRIAEVRGSNPLKSTIYLVQQIFYSKLIKVSAGCGIKAIIHASGARDPGSIPGSPTSYYYDRF